MLTSFCWLPSFSIVVKTQIQLPEELFREVKRFAAEREWSLAETFRRGAELLLQVHPSAPASKASGWMPPKSDAVGWCGLTARQLREMAFSDQEPDLPRR
jgi:hypothetical protein